MAALDFPASPTVNQQYPSPAVTGVPVYTWDGEKWTTKGGAIGSTGGSDAAPQKLGAAAAGSSTLWSRGDHVHPSNFRDQNIIMGSGDLNTFLDAGYWSVQNPTNAPSTGDTWVHLRVQNHDHVGNAYTVQHLTTLSVQPPQEWFRTCANGTWSSWARLDQTSTATTPPNADNDTSIATTAFVKNSVALPASADFNSITDPGVYFSNDSSNTNAPVASQFWFLQVYKMTGGSNIVGQLAMSMNDGRMYKRFFSGSWQPWYSVIDGTMIATVAEYLNNTASKILTTDKVWGAGTAVTLTDAATVSPDFSAGVNFFWAAGASGRTLGNPTNQKAGQAGIIIIQNGANVSTWSSHYKFAGGVKPVGTAGYDCISYYVHFSGFIACSFMGNLS